MSNPCWMRVVDRRGQYFCDFTANRQGVFDKKRKKLNSSCAWQKPANSEKSIGNHGPQIWQSNFFRGGKSIKNRYRFRTIWLVGLEEEIIDKDFRQSYWLALQFWVQPNRIFTVGVPQARKPMEKVMKSASVLVLDITTFLLPQPLAGVWRSRF